MLAKVHSFVLIGIDAIVCEVEVDVSQRGLSKTTIVGLAQVAVKESIALGLIVRAMVHGKDGRSTAVEKLEAAVALDAARLAAALAKEGWRKHPSTARKASLSSQTFCHLASMRCGSYSSARSIPSWTAVRSGVPAGLCTFTPPECAALFGPSAMSVCFSPLLHN